MPGELISSSEKQSSIMKTLKNLKVNRDADKTPEAPSEEKVDQT